MARYSRGVTGAQTTSGHVAVVVLGAVLLAVFVPAWIRTLRLAIMGTDTVMDMGPLFSRKAVRQACLARDWRFG